MRVNTTLFTTLLIFYHVFALDERFKKLVDFIRCPVVLSLNGVAAHVDTAFLCRPAPCGTAFVLFEGKLPILPFVACGGCQALYSLEGCLLGLALERLQRCKKRALAFLIHPRIESHFRPLYAADSGHRPVEYDNPLGELIRAYRPALMERILKNSKVTPIYFACELEIIESSMPLTTES